MLSCSPSPCTLAQATAADLTSWPNGSEHRLGEAITENATDSEHPLELVIDVGVLSHGPHCQANCGDGELSIHIGRKVEKVLVYPDKRVVVAPLDF